jgi:hypothetical protein
LSLVLRRQFSAQLGDGTNQNKQVPTEINYPIVGFYKKLENTISIFPHPTNGQFNI